MKAQFGQVLILSIIIYSCVFSPEKENFVEVDPSSSPPEITIQNLDINSDTIYVWKYTRFNFDFKSSNQPIKSVVVNYGDQNITFQSRSGSFEINPKSYPEGISKIEIKVYTTSGTGSMADKIRAEGYEFKKEWVLIVEIPKDPEINITSGIENGFLKFSWNKMDKPYFRYYRLEIYNGGISEMYNQEIRDKNTTSFIDSLYIGGKITLRLWVMYSDVNETVISGLTEFNYEYPISLTFKEDFENLTISWNRNPFQCTKHFDINGGNPIEINADTSYTIPARGLGYESKYNIGFKPIKQTPYAHRMSDHYMNYSLGENDKIMHKMVEYNSILEKYFFKEETNTSSSNRDIGLEGTYKHYSDVHGNSSLSFSKDNLSVYTTVNHDLVQLNSSGMGFISSKQLPVTAVGTIYPRVLKNLVDDVFLIGYNPNVGNYYAIFNTKTNTTIDTSDKMSGHYASTEYYFYAISVDGKYAAYCSQYGLYIYEIVDNQKLVLRHKDSNEYYSCFFDPKYPEKLVLNRPTGYQIFNCSTLQIEKTNNRFYANPVNIDPLTHYMLLVSNAKKKIYVYDMENDVVKLEMNHHGFAFDFKLLNNIIFVNSGYHFDISSYVD